AILSPRLMRLIKFLLSFVANAVVLVVLVALLAGAGWGAWQLLPAASKTAISKPFDTLQAARRGAARAPAHPLSALIIRSADWRAGYYLRDDLIAGERRDGIEVVGLLMNTPPWAASRAADGVHSVPAGLNRPLDDPQNTWAVFVRKMAADYRGRIDTWIIWNE